MNIGASLSVPSVVNRIGSPAVAPIPEESATTIANMR
jgi:hypothetical protein